MQSDPDSSTLSAELDTLLTHKYEKKGGFWLLKAKKKKKKLFLLLFVQEYTVYMQLGEASLNYVHTLSRFDMNNIYTDWWRKCRCQQQGVLPRRKHQINKGTWVVDQSWKGVEKKPPGRYGLKAHSLWYAKVRLIFSSGYSFKAYDDGFL